ncbi:MAG: hypothetical protein IJ111_13590 [Eggerthellaceae bacterium]|nr:hypothetical protein [Eggerthellaceae bacterium]
MDVHEDAIGVWPNVALVPGTHTHAATGEHVEQPERTKVNPDPGKLFGELLFAGRRVTDGEVAKMLERMGL